MRPTRSTWTLSACSMTRRDLVTLFLIEDMRRKKHKREPGDATRVSVKKEMAKPRMARSARIAELNLNTARIPEQLAGHHRRRDHRRRKSSWFG
jgi:hypothetical protein